jgi:hypothetical protein
MEIYVSINGVLRNFIQKFDFQYQKYFLETEQEESENPFEYKITRPIQNDDLLNHYTFQSKEEYDHFCSVEFPLEIFGHAPLSYLTAIFDLNALIYGHPDINFTVIGLDELGKSKSSTLFFLSKNGFLGNNIKFIKSKDINEEWKKCDLWITDDKFIIDKCPKNKKVVKFVTEYNQYYTDSNIIEINNLTKIEPPCLKFWENATTLTLTKLLKSVGQIIRLKKSKD